MTLGGNLTFCSETEQIKGILNCNLRPKAILSPGRFHTLLFSKEPNPLCLLPKIPPACMPAAPRTWVLLLSVCWRDASFLRLHRDELGMKCVTTRVYSTHNRCMKETQGGGDVRRRGRGSINGGKKDRQTEGERWEERGERCWACHRLARLWLGSYLW